MLTTIIEIHDFLSVYKVLKLNLFPLNYFSSIVNKTMWHLLNAKHSNLWNRIESRNSLSHMWSTDFQQGCQGVIQWKWANLFNKCCWNKDYQCVNK